MPSGKSSAMQLIAYLTAILGITLIGAGSVVALEVLRPDGINTNATYTIIGICSPTLAVLIGVIKSIGNGQIGLEAATNAKEAVEVAKETKKDIIEAVDKNKVVQADVTLHTEK